MRSPRISSNPSLSPASMYIRKQTTNPVVFAAGDVTDVPQYVHVVAMAGKVAARHALRHHEQVEYTGLPSVLFTSPQLASAGMTEAEAIAAGFRFACRYLRLSDVPRAITNHNTRGGIKIDTDADTGKVLGIHALAEPSGEMMLAAITAGFTVTQLADTWPPTSAGRRHPHHREPLPQRTPHLLLRLTREGQPNGPESS